MLTRIIATLSLYVFSSAVAAEEYPALLDVRIGQAFQHPQATERKDTNRPTTQYRVPNYGETKQVFPEYEIAYLNDSNAVAVVTGEAATKSLDECLKTKEQVAQWVRRKFPEYTQTPENQRQIGSPNEYSSNGENTYYVLKCYHSYGPFTYLQLQMRGINEDNQLKQAWAVFFENRKR